MNSYARHFKTPDEHRSILQLPERMAVLKWPTEGKRPMKDLCRMLLYKYECDINN